MNAPMQASAAAVAADDLSTLAWVHDELRRTLEAALKSLRRYLKEAEAAGRSDVDAVDPSVLRSARAHLHQGVGALELVGLPGPARVLRAAESAVQRIVHKPKLMTPAALQTIERVAFALLDYLGRRLAGRTLSPLALFPQYRTALELAGADRVHPADLWPLDWQWRRLPAQSGVAPRAADAAARSAMESQVLGLMRGADRAAMRGMSDLCAGLAAGSSGQAALLWQLAAAFFEAQAAGLLQPDIYSKRVASRLLAQLKASLGGDAEVSERLAQDILFFCARARVLPAAAEAPRLQAVRAAWDLDDSASADYETPRLGRFDPAWIAQARKRVGAARDVWSAVAAGEAHRFSNLGEQFALVGDSLRRLYPHGDALAQALESAAARTMAAGEAPPTALAMEVATSVLYLEATLEDGELDQPQMPEQVLRLAQRLQDAIHGHEAQALEPWMEELYRRVSDRQTMGSVVHELRAALSEVEKEIDHYFRDPAERQVLIPVPNQLSSMRGVLSVLDMQAASQAVLRMRDDVDALVSTEVDPQQAAQAGTFDRLANNLGALSFLIDMLSVQPLLARSLFRFDAASGTLSAVMGRPDKPAGLPAADAAAAPVPVAAVEAVQAVAQPQHEDPARVAMPAEAAPQVAGPTPSAPPAAAAVGDTGLEDDAEMRAIFIEEASEVVHNAGEALARLVEMPDDKAEMTTVRRAFHTLKGSSRMVGLKDFGEAAWACEQLYNAKLAQGARLDGALEAFTQQALSYLGDWVEALAAGRDAGHASPDLIAPADALRQHGRRLPVPAPARRDDREAAAAEPASAAFGAPAATLAERVPDLPSAEALELGLDFELDVPQWPPAAQAADALPDLVESPEGWGEKTQFDSPAEREPGFAEKTMPFEPADVGAAKTLVLTPADEIAAAPPAPPAEPEAFERLQLLFDEPAPEPAGAAALGVPDAFAAAAAAPATAPQGLEVTEVDFEMEAVPVADALPVEDFAGFGAVEVVEAVEAPEDVPAADTSEVVEAVEPRHDEACKQIGPLQIGFPLFNIYLSEADELSRLLATELAEWALEAGRPVGESAVAAAHSLAGSSATVGFADLSALARSLEHALLRSQRIGCASPGEPELFTDAADEVRRLLHQFAAGFLKPVSAELMQRLAQHEIDLAAAPVLDAAPDSASATLQAEWQDEAEAQAERVAAAASEPEPEPPEPAPAVSEFDRQPLVVTRPAPLGRLPAYEDDDDIDGVDAVDPELFPIFQDEGDELLPKLQGSMRDWLRRPSELSAAAGAMRTLHTFKGGARLAGAMRLGERAHRLESAIEQLVARGHARAEDVERLVAKVDAIASTFDALRRGTEPTAPAPLVEQPPAEGRSLEAPAIRAEPAPGSGAIDWSRFAGQAAVAPTLLPKAAVASSGVVRVRAPLLDRLVNEAGEVSIRRARIEADLGQMRSSLGDLSENLERLRRHLRDIELQAESQIASRMEAAKASEQDFDPLEMDRFTRFQELTRMMAESVNDVATVQRGLQRAMQSTEDELAAQARLTRDLQDDLLRTRMVEFEGLSERLYRVVRQAAKDSAKQVRMDIAGGAIEVDRGVLERLTGPLEHLLRNAVAHGIEAPAAREAAGKDPNGRVAIAVAQEGNEVAVSVDDDGAGLNLPRIRARGLELGLLRPDDPVSDEELARLIFAPRFSTAESVTELAGRGVGMDVVRAEIDAMGGRIEVETRSGAGTRVKLVLPLTTAVTQVVLMRCGAHTIAVPSTLVERVLRVRPAELEAAYAGGTLRAGDASWPFYWLGALLQLGARGVAAGRSATVLVIRSASQHIAVHVDEVLGNHEVVVKNLGPQLARLPGLAGVTLLPSGAVALIYNPVALATVYGAQARERMHIEAPADPDAALPTEPLPPLVMVVDDSLTVRRVTQRLLVREGWRVALAKDGMDALEQLAGERPAVLLSDIEMPRMDGFDLVRNIRADPRLAELPVIMISSRIAQKHRDHAAGLGVDHYLGKPYSEDELLGLVRRHLLAQATP